MNKIILIILLIILILILLLTNNKKNFGATYIPPPPPLGDYTRLHINYAKNDLTNYTYKINIKTIPDNTRPVNSNLYETVYKQLPAPGTTFTNGMTVTFWYYNLLDISSKKSIDILSANNDNIDFFNIKNTDSNNNIISLNGVSNVSQTLVNGAALTYFLSIKAPGYLVLYNRDTQIYYYVSSIYSEYVGINYDNVFMFIKSTGEIQMIGIINSSKTVNILWRDIRFVRTSNRVNPFYLKIELNGNLNGYFYDYTIQRNIVNFLDYSRFINNTLTSQPNFNLVKNKQLFNIVNILSGQCTYAPGQLFLGSRLSLSNGTCSLILTNNGNLTFVDSSNSNNNRIILSSNKPPTYDSSNSRFIFIITDIDFCLTIYEVDRADNILNNYAPVAQINLLYKNYMFRDINPAKFVATNPLTVPLSYIINKPYSLFIAYNKLLFTFVEKNTGISRIIPLT